jgi:hypothetical protein
MMDVLGFSKLTESVDANVLYNQYIEFLLSNYANSEFDEFKQVSSLIISDTLFAWSTKNDYNPLYKLIVYAGALVQYSVYGMKNGFNLPLRGAISFDELVTLDTVPFKLGDEEDHDLVDYKTQVVLGKAVVKAHRWEQQQKWIGVSLAPGCVESLTLSQPNVISKLCELNYLVEWDVPTNAGVVNTLAINFVTRSESSSGTGPEYNSGPHLIACLKEQEAKAESLEVRAKYYGTRKFVEHIVREGRYLPTGFDTELNFD